jgi:hypothetical protein
MEAPGSQAKTQGEDEVEHSDPAGRGVVLAREW